MAKASGRHCSYADRRQPWPQVTDSRAIAQEKAELRKGIPITDNRSLHGVILFAWYRKAGGVFSQVTASAGCQETVLSIAWRRICHPILPRLQGQRSQCELFDWQAGDDQCGDEGVECNIGYAAASFEVTSTPCRS